ncbi:MAG: tryptophan synthase subunit beta, partial [Verrucomicrobiota bacterium]|nr:tryptophan synthase subunit beta [Verrucomicrobiota bacterium]
MTSRPQQLDVDPDSLPDDRGHFGAYGGMYVPETLMTPLYELTEAYHNAQKDPEFQ